METVKIDESGYYFVHNKVMVATALLKEGEYLLYFNSGGYDGEVLQMCLDSINILNSNLTGETNE